MQQIKSLSNKVSQFEKLKSEYEDVTTLIELGLEENDGSVFSEVKDLSDKFVKNFETQRLAALLSGEYDKNNAICTLQSGAGGTEACDWVGMLFRMFLRWAEKRGFSTEILDMQDGEEAGIKSVMFQINGENAYGYMKSEKGVHRLVRISPFDASGKRHTSFASCEIMPEIDADIDFDINEEELRIDTYRSSGAGGQHVNKTESAIRITHLPTGIVVQCQNERSQHKNKDRAMKILKSRLAELRHEENAAKIQDIRGQIKDIAWGSQIRSYVFHPYNMVKDHRTNEETGNVGAVMDGLLDPFINAYLNMAAKDKNSQ